MPPSLAEQSPFEVFAAKPEDVSFHMSAFRWGADSSSLDIAVETKSWWAEETTDVVLVIQAEGILESVLYPPYAKAEVECKIDSADPLLLHYAPHTSVFCHSPLPDPHRFFTSFGAALRDTLDIPRDPLTYLNWQGNFRDWLLMVYSRMYNLLTAPKAVVDEAVNLLEEQAVEHVLLPEPGGSDEQDEVFAVRVGRSWLVCEKLSLETS